VHGAVRRVLGVAGAGHHLLAADHAVLRVHVVADAGPRGLRLVLAGPGRPARPLPPRPERVRPPPPHAPAPPPPRRGPGRPPAAPPTTARSRSRRARSAASAGPGTGAWAAHDAPDTPPGGGGRPDA